MREDGEDEEESLNKDGRTRMAPAGHMAAPKTRRRLARWRTNICEVEKQIINFACEVARGCHS